VRTDGLTVSGRHDFRQNLVSVFGQLLSVVDPHVLLQVTARREPGVADGTLVVKVGDWNDCWKTTKKQN
jgi:hypothetical protein